jgi:hypothetical protein
VRRLKHPLQAVGAELGGGDVYSSAIEPDKVSAAHVVALQIKPSSYNRFTLLRTKNCGEVSDGVSQDNPRLS